MLLKCRLVPNNQTVDDLVDLFQNDGFTRVTGLDPISAQVFFNNAPQSWPTVDGTDVTDVQVTSGSVYWSEVVSGFYSVRWRPTAVGFWRLVFAYSSVPQIVTLDYDVRASQTAPLGLHASFVG